MELKRIQTKAFRSKSEEVFQMVKKKSLEKLRLKSQYNGILQRQPSPKKPIHGIQNEEDTKKKSKETKYLNVRNFRSNTHLPKLPEPSSKPLKLNSKDNIKNYIPSQGYIELNMNDKTSSVTNTQTLIKNYHSKNLSIQKQLVFPTLSKNGILYPHEHTIELIGVDEFERRKKLMELKIVKKILELKTFLKWKKIAKQKKYHRCLYLISNQHSKEFISKKMKIYVAMTDFIRERKTFTYKNLTFQGIDEYERYWMKCLDFIREGNQSLFVKFLQLIETYILCPKPTKYKPILYESMRNQEKHYLLRIFLYKYHEFKYESFLSIMNVIGRQLESIEKKLTSINIDKLSIDYDLRKVIKEKQNYESVQHPQICIKIEFEQGKIMVKFETSRIDEVYCQFYKRMKKLMENNSYVEEKLYQRMNLKEFLLILEGNDTYISKNFNLETYLQSFISTQKSILKINMQKLKQLAKQLQIFLKNCEPNEENDFQIPVFCIKNKLIVIQDWPDFVNLGFLIIDIKSVKEEIKLKLNEYIEIEAEELPKRLEEYCEQISYQIQRFEGLVRPGREETISSLEKIFQEIIQFKEKIFKDIHQKLANMELSLKVLIEINPKTYENFYLAKYRLAENLRNTENKVAPFLQNLPKRLSYMSAEKHKARKALFQNFEKLIEVMQTFRSSDELSNEVLKKKLRMIEMKYSRLIEEKRVLNWFQAMEGQFLLARINPTQITLLDKIGVEISLFKKIFQKQQKISKMLFNAQVLGEKIGQFDKFNSIHQVFTELETLLHQISYMHENAPLIKCQINEFLDYKKFINCVINIKDSPKLYSELKQKTITGLWEEKYHVDHWQRIEAIRYKEKNIDKLLEFKRELNIILQNKIFISQQDEIQNKKLKIKQIQSAIIVLEEVIIKYNKYKTIFTSPVMCDDTDIFQKYTNEINYTIQSLEKLEGLLHFIKILKDKYNSQTDFLKQEILQTGQKKLEDKWNLLLSFYREKSIKSLINDKKLEELTCQIDEIVDESEQQINSFFQSKIQEFSFYALAPRIVIYKGIIKPLTFIEYFLKHVNSITVEDNLVIKIITRCSQILQLDSIRHKNFDAKTIMREIQNFLYEKTIQLEQLRIKQGQNCLEYLYDPELFGTPLQIVNFIDSLNLKTMQIDNISKQISQLTQRWKNLLGKSNLKKFDKEYEQRLMELLIMNRIQKRDMILDLQFEEGSDIQYCSEPNCWKWKQFNFTEDDPLDKNLFYIQLHNCRIYPSYHLVDMRKISPLFGVRATQAYIKTLTAIVQNTLAYVSHHNHYLIENASLRVMKYCVEMEYMSNISYRLIQILQLSKVFFFVKLSKNQSVEEVNSFIQKYQKISYRQSQTFDSQKFPKLPCFILIKDTKKLPSHQFRSLSPITPRFMPILQMIIYSTTQSKLSQKLLPYVLSEGRGKPKNKNYSLLVEIKIILQKISYAFEKGEIDISFKEIMKIIKIFFSKEKVFLRNNEAIEESVFSELLLLCTQSQKFTQEQFNDFFKQKLSLSHELQNSGPVSLGNIYEDVSKPESRPTQALVGIKKLNPFEKKLQQFHEMIQQEDFVMIVGEQLTGKSHFLDKYLHFLGEKYQHRKNYKKIVLNVEALHSKIWEFEKLFFENLDIKHSETFIVFDGRMEERMYYYYENMIENKVLYYNTGEKVDFNSSVKILFQVASTSSIKPSTFLSLKYILLDNNFVKWIDILKHEFKMTNKIIFENLEQGLENNKSCKITSAFEWERLSQEITTLLVGFFETFSIEVFRILPWISEKIVIKNTCSLFYTYQKCLIILILNQITQNKKIICVDKELTSIFLYCFYWTMYFSIQTKMHIELRKKFIQMYSQFDKEVDFNFLNEKLVFDEKKGRFHFTAFDSPNKTTIKNNIVFVWTRQMKICGYFCEQLLGEKRNAMLMGEKSTGKSNLLKNISYPVYSCRYKMQAAYKKMLLTITGENFKQKNPLIVQVEDFHLEVNQNAGECLKYLWETNLFYNTKTSFIDSLQSFNLVLEHENQGPLLPTFRHLYPITFQPFTHSIFEYIYSHKIITHINQSFCINIANIDNYPDVMSKLSFRRYLEGIKVINDFFLPVSRKEWIHLYREKLFDDAVEMFCEAVPLTRQAIWNEPPNEKTTEYKDMLSSLISQILAHITKNLLHLLYLRLSNQEYLQLHTLINKSIFVLRTNQGQTDRIIPVQEKKAIEKAVYGALTYHEIKITDILTRNIDKICQIFEIPLKKLVFVNCLYWHPIGYLLDFVIESMMKDKNQILVVKSEFENFDAYVTFMDGFIDRQEWKIKHQTIKPIITSLKTPKTPKKTLFYLYYPAHTLLSTKNLLNYIQEYQMIQETEEMEIIHIVEYVEDDENFIAQMIKENGRLVDESLIVVLEREGKKERKEKVHEILSRNRELVEKNPHLPDTLCNVYQQLEEGIKQLESQNPISSVFDCKKSFYEWFGYKSITPLDTIMTVDVFSHTLRLFNKKYSSSVRVLSQRRQLLRQGNLVIDKLIKQEQQKSKQLKELQINLNKYYTEEKLYMKELKDLNDQIQSFDNSNDKVKIASIKENIKKKNHQISAYIKQRSQLLTSSQTLHSSITRTQLSQYKYIFTNNFANYADLFSGLSLALSGDDDYETIHKNINDVNLMTKIKDLSMKKMKFQTVKLINSKIKAQKNILSEDRKGIRNLMEWLYCASEYEIYCREEAQTIFKLKKQINQNQNTIRTIEQEYKIPQKLKIKESKQEYIEGKKNKMHELENSVGKIEKILQKIQDLQELTKLKQFSCTWINKISMKISLLLPISLYIAFSQTILLRLQGQQFSIMKKQIKNTIMREFKVSEDFEKYIGLEEYIEDHEQGGQNLEQTEIHNKIKARLLKSSKESMSTCTQLYRTVSDHIKEGIISHRSPIFTQFRLTKNKLIKLLTFIFLVKVFVGKEKKMIGTKGVDLQPIIVIDKEGTFTNKLEEFVKFYEGVESERSCGDVLANCKNAWKNCMFIEINADEWSISEEKQIVQQYYKQKEKVYWVGQRKVIVPQDTLPIFLKTQPPTQNINPYDQPYAFSHFKIINFGTDTEDEEESLLLQLEESIYNEMEEKKIRVAATKEMLECQCLKLYEILQVVRSVSIEDSNILSMLMKDTLNWLEVKKTHQQNRIKCEEQSERSELLIEKIANRLLTLYKTYKQAQIIKYHKLSNTYTFTQFLHLISSCGKYLTTDLLDEEKYYQYYEEIYKIVLYQFMHEKCGRQFQIIYYIKYKNDEMFEQNNYHKFNNLLFESGWFKTLKTILNFRGMLYEGAILKELVLDHKSLTKKIQNLIGSLGQRAEISETEVMNILMHPSFTSIQQFQLLKLFMPHLFSSVFHDHLQSSPSYLEDFHSVNKTLSEYFSKHILICYCNVEKWRYYLTKNRNIERHQRRAGCLGSIFFHDMNDKIKYKIEIVTYTEDDQLSKFVNRLRLQIKKEKFIVVLIEENKYHWTHDEFKSQTISVGKLLKLFWESFIKNGHLFAEYNNFRNLKLFENQYTYEELEEQFIQYKHFEELILNKFEVKNIWDEKNISHFVQKINNSSAYVSEFFSSLSNLTNSEITIFEIKKIMEECRLKLHETLKDRSAPQLELVSQALSSNTQINTPIHSYIREYRNKIEEQFQKIRQKSRFHTKIEKLEVYGHLPSIRLELRKLLKLLGSYLRFRRDQKAADDEVELGLIIGFSKIQQKETINRTRKKKKMLRSESITKRTRFRANSIQKFKIKQ